MQPTTKVPEAPSLRSRLFGKSYEMYAQAAGITVDEWKAETKFSGIDLGWVILCVGMSLGAGIVFLPSKSGYPVCLSLLSSLSSVIRLPMLIRNCI